MGVQQQPGRVSTPKRRGRGRLVWLRGMAAALLGLVLLGALYAQLDLPQVEAYDYAIEVMAATSQLPDAQEGMRAFLEKRTPEWRRGARPHS